MAFADTLLLHTKRSPLHIVLVDQNPQPGGHWLHDYDFVHLHQPSIVYGVESTALEGNWLTQNLLSLRLPWQHRASKPELVEYYRKLMEAWTGRTKGLYSNVGDVLADLNDGAQKQREAGGSRNKGNTPHRVEFFPCSTFDFEAFVKGDGKTIRFSQCSESGSRTSCNVQVREKVVNAVLGANAIPSQCPPNFKHANNINLVTVNDVFSMTSTSAQERKATGGSWFSWGSGKSSQSTTSVTKETSSDATNSESYRKAIEISSKSRFVVIGAGKTGMDCVHYLLTELDVSPDQIFWVLSQDVWMLNRASASPQRVVEYTLKALEGEGDERSINLALERDGHVFRLDASKKVEPTASRFPTISIQELEVLRKVEKLIRQGRIREITADGDLIFENGHVTKREFFRDPEDSSTSSDIFYIHCSSPGPFAGKKPLTIFPRPNYLCLWPLVNPPTTQSGSFLAAIECARLNKTLNTSLIQQVWTEIFAKNDDLLAAATSTDSDFAKPCPENQLEICLSAMFQPGLGESAARILLNIAGIQLILDGSVPDKGTKFLKNNRLSLFSIPGAKVNSEKNLGILLEKKRKSLSLLEEKLLQIYLPHVAKAE